MLRVLSMMMLLLGLMSDDVVVGTDVFCYCLLLLRLLSFVVVIVCFC